MPSRLCSECSNPLEGLGPRAKTCSQACRAKRSRRIRGAVKAEREYEAEHPRTHAEIRAVVRAEHPDAISKAMTQELRPVIREAITEDVLRAINSLVGLTSTAVEAIQEDLISEDKFLRQRAYTLLLKYTAGHPAIVRPTDADSGKQINVTFALPRPDADAQLAADEGITMIEDAEEMRTCDMCRKEKPAGEFVTNSTRCQICFDEWKEKVIEKFKS